MNFINIDSEQVLKYLGYIFIGKITYDIYKYTSPIVYKKLKNYQ